MMTSRRSCDFPARVFPSSTNPKCPVIVAFWRVRTAPHETLLEIQKLSNLNKGEKSL